MASNNLVIALLVAFLLKAAAGQLENTTTASTIMVNQSYSTETEDPLTAPSSTQSINSTLASSNQSVMATIAGSDGDNSSDLITGSELYSFTDGTEETTVMTTEKPAPATTPSGGSTLGIAAASITVVICNLLYRTKTGDY